MPIYRCRPCGYVYSEKSGDPAHSIAPGTKFEDLPADWVCPVCGASRDQFEKIDEAGELTAFVRQPIGPLMIEHRLIERIVPVLARELEALEQGKLPDTKFLLECADFFHTYADRVHHGKEEDILFKAMEEIKISEAESALIKELLAQHREAREHVKALILSCRKQEEGNSDESGEIKEILKFLIKLYPEHIKNEDKIFFPESMKYFSAPDQEKMTAAMKEFDERIIHDKYREAMEGWEKR